MENVKAAHNLPTCQKSHTHKQQTNVSCVKINNEVIFLKDLFNQFPIF